MLDKLKKLGALGSILIILVVLGLHLMTKYNTLVTKDEGIKAAWANVEGQYQRRADLIPNLVSTVKGFADHEATTLTEVTEARAKATSTTVDVNDIESLKQFQASQGELGSALSRLLVSVEAYPDIKASPNFLDLQAQLEGTENRIAVERGRYNELVKDYNIYVRQFPTNLSAQLLGFDKANLFEADPSAATVPVVDFN